MEALRELVGYCDVELADRLAGFQSASEIARGRFFDGGGEKNG